MDGVLRFVGSSIPQLVGDDDTVAKVYPRLYLVSPPIPARP